MRAYVIAAFFLEAEPPTGPGLEKVPPPSTTVISSEDAWLFASWGRTFEDGKRGGGLRAVILALFVDNNAFLRLVASSWYFDENSKTSLFHLVN